LVCCSAPYKYTYLLAYSPSQNSQCAAISRPQNKQINSSVWSLRATAVTRRYPHFAAERRCPPLAIYVCCRRRRSAANQPAALLLSIDGTDRQTDGHPDRYIDRAGRTMRQRSVSCCAVDGVLAFSVAGRLLGLPRAGRRPVDEVRRHVATSQPVQPGHLAQPHRRQQQRRRSVSLLMTSLSISSGQED